VDKTFGESFGELIREKRGQEQLTQEELAIRAFDDESKVRRIIDLENGSVKRPHVKTVDPLVAYFGITREELSACKQHGLFSQTEQARIGLSRALMENLALRFEHDDPDAPDEELFAFLQSKAEELKRLKQRLSKLEEGTASLSNQIKAANNAIEVGRFEEADEILAAAEEIQQEERTLKEIRVQSEIRFARGDAALLSGNSDGAASHYVKAAAYFTNFDQEEAAKRLGQAAGQIYEIERRSPKPNLKNAIDLAERAIGVTPTAQKAANWALRKYQLALLQQTEGRMGGADASKFFDQAIANAKEALAYSGSDFETADRVYCMIVLGNSYGARGDLSDKDKSDNIDAAIKIFEDILENPKYTELTLARGIIYNNLSIAYRRKGTRGVREKKQFIKKERQALFRAIELSGLEGNIEVWSNAQANLGYSLAEQADITAEPHQAAFLRTQAMAAFQASLETYPDSAFSLPAAETALALGRVQLDLARSSTPSLKEAYLARSIESNEAATRILGKENYLQKWSQAQFCIGLAFFLHAEISEHDAAVEDLQRATSYFDAAVPGYQTSGMENDLKKLKAARDETTARLTSLRTKAKRTPG
jgi:transcriptional regulator with XRE-family HTH domain